jgi:hypothetical protein
MDTTNTTSDDMPEPVQQEVSTNQTATTLVERKMSGPAYWIYLIFEGSKVGIKEPATTETGLSDSIFEFLKQILAVFAGGSDFATSIGQYLFKDASPYVIRMIAMAVSCLVLVNVPTSTKQADVQKLDGRSYKYPRWNRYTSITAIVVCMGLFSSAAWQQYELCLINSPSFEPSPCTTSVCAWTLGKRVDDPSTSQRVAYEYYLRVKPQAVLGSGDMLKVYSTVNPSVLGTAEITSIFGRRLPQAVHTFNTPQSKDCCNDVYSEDWNVQSNQVQSDGCLDLVATVVWNTTPKDPDSSPMSSTIVEGTP